MVDNLNAEGAEVPAKGRKITSASPAITSVSSALKLLSTNRISSVQSPATTTIAIVGLGYVGLPLSLQFARSGVSVIGLDIDQTKVDSLNRGNSFIKHVPSETIAELV